MAQFCREIFPHHGSHLGYIKPLQSGPTGLARSTNKGISKGDSRSTLSPGIAKSGISLGNGVNRGK